MGYPAFGYRTTRKPNIVCSGVPACVVAVFNPVGDFKPVSFGVELDGLRYRYNINRIVVFKESHGNFTFDCEYVDLGRIIPVRLVFNVSQCRWVIG